MIERTPAEALADAMFPYLWASNNKARESAASALREATNTLKRLNSLGFDVVPIGDGRG